MQRVLKVLICALASAGIVVWAWQSQEGGFVIPLPTDRDLVIDGEAYPWFLGALALALAWLGRSAWRWKDSAVGRIEWEGVDWILWSLCALLCGVALKLAW